MQNSEKFAWVCVSVLLVSTILTSCVAYTNFAAIEQERNHSRTLEYKIELLKRGVSLSQRCGGAIPRISAQGLLFIPENMNLEIYEIDLYYAISDGHSVAQILWPQLPRDDVTYSLEDLKAGLSLGQTPIGSVYLVVYLITGQGYAWLVVAER